MARATGIGGIFFKARDPKALSAWYAKYLNLSLSEYGGATFRWSDELPKGTGATSWSLFPADTKYFGPGGQTAMVNYRVDDLDGILARMKADGIHVEPGPPDEGYGRFAWAIDPEGNRLELWQPTAH